jgi:hypothetical protein
MAKGNVFLDAKGTATAIKELEEHINETHETIQGQWP